MPLSLTCRSSLNVKVVPVQQCGRLGWLDHRDESQSREAQNAESGLGRLKGVLQPPPFCNRLGPSQPPVTLGRVGCNDTRPWLSGSAPGPPECHPDQRTRITVGHSGGLLLACHQGWPSHPAWIRKRPATGRQVLHAASTSTGPAPPAAAAPGLQEGSKGRAPVLAQSFRPLGGLQRTVTQKGHSRGVACCDWTRREKGRDLRGRLAIGPSAHRGAEGGVSDTGRTSSWRGAARLGGAFWNVSPVCTLQSGPKGFPGIRLLRPTSATQRRCRSEETA